ncbi:hypothetical protein CDAR_317941 [Caerostris darwini]|uniref:Uncharacterized protein n=1 Tax=Caerostris darwini TaxID=1538125 RepID=A0AAV4WTT8_9ARAC|nr:hypothetical protein CDAR_317941 [Caerostris darwini]
MGARLRQAERVMKWKTHVTLVRYCHYPCDVTVRKMNQVVACCWIKRDEQVGRRDFLRCATPFVDDSLRLVPEPPSKCHYMWHVRPAVNVTLVQGISRLVLRNTD